MSKSGVEFHISGKQGQQAAKEIQRLAREILKQEAHVTVAMENGIERRSIDPALATAIAALVVALPSGMLSALQLKDRFAKKDTMDDFLGKVRAVGDQYQVDIRIRKSDGSIVEIHAVNSGDVIDGE